jgi:hypothetical protein
VPRCAASRPSTAQAIVTATVVCVVPIKGAIPQGHHPIPGVLVNCAFETVHLCGDRLEAAINNLVHLFWIQLLGQGREASHIGEQDGNLATLPFQGTARAQDLLGQVWRRVVLALYLRGARKLHLVTSSVSPRR